MTSEDHPEVFSKVVHTASLLCLGFDSATQVIVNTKNAISEMKTGTGETSR